MEAVMHRALDEKLGALAPDRRARIEAEADRLHAEYLTLKEIRRWLSKTQTGLAAEMGVAQATIAQLEQQDDWLLSTLRRYVKAAGGELTVMVELPDRPPVRLTAPE
jgi:DNA-binding XRE family transcriptional regulator